MPDTHRRPNILLAIADDASHLGTGSLPCLRTPAYDSVAQRGVVFTNAFTSNPKCAPSRACLLTGRHTWQLDEACNHHGVFPARFAVYPDLLEAAGYFVGFTGKGWAPGDYARGGFRRNPAGPEYNRRTLIPPPETCIAHKDYAANFADFLSERPDGKPFCFWYGGFEPHRPYSPGEGARAGKKPADAGRLPPYWPQENVVRNDVLDYANEIEWFDLHLGRMLDQLREAGELENTLVLVTSDNGMPFPRVKGQMYEQDFHLPMAACWPAAAAGGRAIADLIGFVDVAPTFLAAAGLPPHPHMAGRSFLDLLLSGREGQVDPSRTRAYFGRERHDLGREDDLGYPVRCIRTPQYLYVRNFAPERWPAGNPETGFTNCDSSPTKSRILELHAGGESACYDWCFGRRPAEELYDVLRDPDCVTNLAGNPEFAALKKGLWQELQETLRRTGDPRIEGRGDVFEGYPYVGRDHHSWKALREGRWQPQKY